MFNAHFNNHYRGGQFYTQLENRRTTANHRLVPSNWISHKAEYTAPPRVSNANDIRLCLFDNCSIIYARYSYISPNHDILHGLISWQIYKVLMTRHDLTIITLSSTCTRKLSNQNTVSTFIQCFSWMSLYKGLYSRTTI